MNIVLGAIFIDANKPYAFKEKETRTHACREGSVLAGWREIQRTAL